MHLSTKAFSVTNVLKGRVWSQSASSAASSMLSPRFSMSLPTPFVV